MVVITGTAQRWYRLVCCGGDPEWGGRIVEPGHVVCLPLHEAYMQSTRAAHCET